MNDLSWLLILLFTNILTGWAMYHFGHGIGMEQQKIWFHNRRKAKQAKHRRQAMQRHPAGKAIKQLRLVPADE